MTSACTPVWQTKPTVSPDTLFDAHQHTLASLERWEIRGRTVIIQGKEGWNVGLWWQENKTDYHIKLEGPFAQGGMTLDGDERNVILTMDDGQQFSAATPEELIMSTLGWTLPISALRDWIKGMPYAEKELTLVEHDDEGRITHLIQGDWDIEYRRYAPFNGSAMPAKIFITHPDLSVKLIIRKWSSL
ncbi:MAG: outer membrane lipoprotein LolB [Gammaproteobacteria bacterium]|nr:MAG: outer membrane lipoprotein LolB [Gammaproteobacteria bacterium]